MKIEAMMKQKFLLVLLGVCLLGVPVRAASVFTELFQYTQGANLAGQNGGSGFAGAWAGGSSTIVAGIGGGSTTSLQVGSESQRSLLATFNTSGNTFYLSYIMNSSDFFGGNYTGYRLALHSMFSLLYRCN